jgi:hypothetical protein
MRNEQEKGEMMKIYLTTNDSVLRPATMVSTSVLPFNDVKLTLEVCDMNAIHGIRADTSSTEQNLSYSTVFTPTTSPSHHFKPTFLQI